MGKIRERLSIEERTMIQTQPEPGIKPAAIAAGLNRSASTLSLELHRNGLTRPGLQSLIEAANPVCGHKPRNSPGPVGPAQRLRRSATIVQPDFKGPYGGYGWT